MWSELLERLDIDIDETFLELGGDSIAATLCVNRILKLYGIPFSYSALLSDEMTIRALADSIDQELRRRGSNARPG